MTRANRNKIIIIFILLSFFSASFFYLSRRLKPEQFKKMMVSSIEKILTNTSIDIHDLNISSGLTIVAKMNDIILSSRDKKMKFMSIKDMEVKIPFSSFLMGRGHLKIELDGVDYLKRGDPLEMGTNKERKVDPLTLPGIFRNSSADIRITNFKYQNNLRTKVLNISRLNLKNLNIKSTTAFEVKSTYEFTDEKEEKSFFNLSIIGQFSISDYLSNGRLKILSTMNMSDIRTSIVDIDIPNMKGNINFNLSSNGQLSGETNLTLKEFDFIKGKFFIDEKTTKVEDVEIKVKTSNMVKILKLKDYIVAEEKQWFEFVGDMSLENGKDLKGKVSYNSGIFNFKNLEGGISLSLKGEIDKGMISGSFDVEGLSGSGNLRFEGIDILEFQDVSRPVELSIEGGNFNLDEILSKESQLLKDTDDIESILKSNLNLKADVDLRNITLFDSKFDLIGDISLISHKVESKSLRLKWYEVRPFVNLDYPYISKIFLRQKKRYKELKKSKYKRYFSNKKEMSFSLRTDKEKASIWVKKLK